MEGTAADPRLLPASELLNLRPPARRWFESYGAASPWTDGVRLGRHHRHEGYWVLKREDAPLRANVFDRAGYEVSARDAWDRLVGVEGVNFRRFFPEK